MSIRTRNLGAIALCLCSACVSTSVWQASGEFTPLSYRRADEGFARSVGKLRRLVLLPVRLEQARQEVVEGWSSRALRILSDQKGYEVIPLDLYEDIIATRLDVSVEETRRNADRLTRWASESADGAPPPEDVVGVVSRLGRGLKADAVVVIHGLTSMLGADLFEVATGRIVWRRRMSTPSPPFAPWIMDSLFHPLEHAVPRALIEE